LTTLFAEKFWSSRGLDENVARRRNVLNISSIAGVHVYPDLGLGLYSAEKAALNFATYHLASEMRHIGVRVNALAPDTSPGRVPRERVVHEMLAIDDSDEQVASSSSTIEHPRV